MQYRRELSSGDPKELKDNLAKNIMVLEDFLIQKGIDIKSIFDQSQEICNYSDLEDFLILDEKFPEKDYVAYPCENLIKEKALFVKSIVLVLSNLSYKLNKR